MNTYLAQFMGGVMVVLSVGIAISLLLKPQQDAEGKTKPASLPRYFLAILLLCLLITASYRLFIHPMLVKPENEWNANEYALALDILSESTSTYTSSNNLSAVSRSNLLDKLDRLKKLNLSDLMTMTDRAISAIRSAPSSGHSGIYDMQMTSSVRESMDSLKSYVMEKSKRLSRTDR